MRILRPMPASRPRVLAILPRFSPTAWIYIIKPLTALHEAGRITARITLESLASPGAIERADVVVFCRNVNPDRAGLLRTAVRCGVPVLYDLDDNFFEIPPDSAVGQTCAQPPHLAMLKEYLSTASLVRVYSRPLRERATALNDHVEMVDSTIDLEQVRPPAASSTGPIKLVYATSRLDDPLAGIFLPALRRLLDDVGSRIDVHFWGPRPPRDLPGVRHHAVVHNYDRFLQRFSSAGFEIGLAPFVDDAFHRSKTNTKFREYGACGIAGIYSNVAVYSECVRHGDTGLLVSSTAADWYQAMRQLVDDVALRRKIQRQARAAVKERYSQTRFEAMFLDQIERLASSRPLSDRLRPSPLHSDRNTHPEETRHAMLGGYGIAAIAHDAGPPRLTSLPGLIPRAISHLRQNGLARGWNTVRWLGSSGWSLARLQWRLRE